MRGNGIRYPQSGHRRRVLATAARPASSFRSRFWSRRACSAVLAIATSLGLGWPLTAFGVHDDGLFELEGNIADDAAAPPDWAALFDSNGNAVSPGSGLAFGFVADDIAPGGLNDDTVFTAGGTKNSQQPSVDWQWGTQSVPEKDDLFNVYAYGTLNAAGHLVLYAGLERLAPNGASHIDIEFNRESIALDEAPPCTTSPASSSATRPSVTSSLPWNSPTAAILANCGSTSGTAATTSRSRAASFRAKAATSPTAYLPTPYAVSTMTGRPITVVPG